MFALEFVVTNLMEYKVVPEVLAEVDEVSTLR